MDDGSLPRLLYCTVPAPVGTYSDLPVPTVRTSCTPSFSFLLLRFQGGWVVWFGWWFGLVWLVVWFGWWFGLVGG
jgi:hypothetical protein